MPFSHDVIIAGAGPAGSMAALALARAGRKVALLDRATFPRAKVCGNCINPSAWKIWDQLGLTEEFSALPHQEIGGLSIASEGRSIYRHLFHAPRRGPRAVSRTVLDDWLRRKAQEAGAEFHPETAVTGIDPQTGEVQTSRGLFSGKIILGADGRNSVVGRLCQLLPAPRRCHRVAWQAMIEAPPNLDDQVHMNLFEEGYYGYCRFNPTQAVVSIVLDARQTQDPLLAARRYLPDFFVEEWTRMNPISRGPAKLGRGRVWLIGDSARVVEPFTGEGITFALSTALLAAGRIDQSFRQGLNFSAAFRSYQRAHRMLYLRRSWVNTLVRAILESPGRTVRIFRKVRPAPALLSVLVDRVHTA